MRKTYHKPKLWYEDFRLSQSIAAGCMGIANYAEGQCTVTYEGPGYKFELFSAGTCPDSPPNPDDYVCYHAPYDGMNVYSS